MLNTISDERIAATLDYETVREWIERAFFALARGAAAIKPRQRIDCGGAKLSSMGALWAEDVALAAEKTYTTVEGRFAFLLTLFCTRSNRVLAVMQAEELTRLRTAALSVMVAERAARSLRKLVVFGLGRQGLAQAQALSALPFESIAVVDSVDVSAACAALAETCKRPVRQVQAAQAIREADVIVTATRSKSPLFDGGLLAPGCLVIAVGTSLPQGSELDAETLRRAARVIVEFQPQSLLEAGEVALGRSAGVLGDERIVDLPDIFSERAPWRRDPNEILVFKSVGVGLSDLAAAAAAWQRVGDRAQ
jgi:ornithine cyclodeaminase